MLFRRCTFRPRSSSTFLAPSAKEWLDQSEAIQETSWLTIKKKNNNFKRKNRNKRKKFFKYLANVRSEQKESSGSSEMFNIKRSIIFREIWISSVSENRLEEVQVGDERARSKAINFHLLCWINARNNRRHSWAQ